ncbi:hypothetical protein [Peribacillus frigoritolerans]|jgi:uncharacterized protein YndB with AHSA1/START domain|nr:hypothetical protein [Peribacillus frigoritolerans]MCR8870183.1 hypothetical protein [Peribacillus frigoritolerans]
MRCTDENQGEFYGQESVYQEITVPEKIVLTDMFADEDATQPTVCQLHC